jgi:hypothetical protein
MRPPIDRLLWRANWAATQRSLALRCIAAQPSTTIAVDWAKPVFQITKVRANITNLTDLAGEAMSNAQVELNPGVNQLSTDTTATQHTEGGRYRVWPESRERFSTSRISPIHHTFNEHPLMQLPALAELAHRLMPTGQCRFVTPGITQSSEFLHESKTHDGRSLDEVFRRIEEPGSWIAMYNVEKDPLYRAFLDEVQQAVKPLVADEQPGIFNVGGFIFISAPPSVTPFHIDRENNFWLQISGSKTMTVWPHTDRETVSAKDVEEFVLYRSLERVRLDDSNLNRSQSYDTSAGDGLYFPATTPHMTRSTTDWVKPGNSVAISMATVFYSDVTVRHARVHQFNQLVRRLGFSPRDPGQSPVIDSLKAPLGRVLARVRYQLINRTPPPGSY